MSWTLLEMTALGLAAGVSDDSHAELGFSVSLEKRTTVNPK
jgi:hypothetical protein